MLETTSSLSLSHKEEIGNDSICNSDIEYSCEGDSIR
jgi:hypothetical protein